MEDEEEASSQAVMARRYSALIMEPGRASLAIEPFQRWTDWPVMAAMWRARAVLEPRAAVAARKAARQASRWGVAERRRMGSEEVSK